MMKVSLDSHFIIYGAGEVGNECYKRLTTKGFTVDYALDAKHSGTDMIPGINTFIIGTENCVDKDRCIVIICLANGLVHKNVANNLYKHGYKYLVFLPMLFCLRDEEKIRLTKEYNYFLKGELKKSLIVNDFVNYANPVFEPDDSILREYDDELIIWCRLELLNTESIVNRDITRIHQKSEFKDINISINSPFCNLFDYLSGKVSSPKKYFDARKSPLSVTAKEETLRSREKLFGLYELEYNKGLDFFVEGAPIGVWNNSGYWNLLGGHHRTLFLLHKNHTLFPIRVTKKDFEKSINYPAFEALKKYITDNQIEELYAPIPHPGFINFPAKYDLFGKTALEGVLNLIYEIYGRNIQNLTAIDALDDEGYFARVLSRSGLGKVVNVNNSELEGKVSELCSRELLRTEIENVIPEEIHDMHRSYDIVFCKQEMADQFFQLSKDLFIVETIDSFKVIPNGICFFNEYRHMQQHAFYMERV